MVSNTTSESPPRKTRTRRKRGKRPQSQSSSAKPAPQTDNTKSPRRAAQPTTAVPAKQKAPARRRSPTPKAPATNRTGTTGRKSAPRVVKKFTSTRRSTGQIMVINVSRGEECRIAIVNNGKLEEIYFERRSAESHVGNIYKATVTNVEPSIQAAFIDFGIGKNGFLHVSDLQPQYFPGRKRESENVGRKISRRDRPPIQKCLKRGDDVMVQVIKEGIGTKGPTLSTYLSIPGRYLVMMPGMSKLGVSRKIEDLDLRQDMRGILEQLDLPPDMGFILRTAGLDRTKRDFQTDLNYLRRLWATVVQRIKAEPAPASLYQESDLLVRTIRDVLTTDFDAIVIDDEETAQQAREFLRIIMPRSVGMVEIYNGKQPLFHKYELEAEIERIYSKHVPLASGGSLVIESTEALVAIDVNSGKYRAQDNPEATAYRINLEAAEEIARQLLLRDLGGLIVCDFIDMMDNKHKREVEKVLRLALKAHKERVQILRMSQFGIIEITRQRQRASIKSSMFEDCTHCLGSGLVKSAETLALDVMRSIQSAIHQENVHTLTATVPPAVGFFLLNRKRAALTLLEEELSKRIIIAMGENQAWDQYSLEAQDERATVVKLDGLDLPSLPKSRR